MKKGIRTCIIATIVTCIIIISTAFAMPAGAEITNSQLGSSYSESYNK